MHLEHYKENNYDFYSIHILSSAIYYLQPLKQGLCERLFSKGGGPQLAKSLNGSFSYLKVGPLHLEMKIEEWPTGSNGAKKGQKVPYGAKHGQKGQRGQTRPNGVKRAYFLHACIFL